MKRIMIWVLIGLVVANSLAQESQAPAKPWEDYRTKEFGIVLPRGWRNLPLRMGAIQLYLQGDGRDVPALDETGSPLQIGLMIEKYPNTKETPEEGVKGLVKAAKANPRLELIGKEAIEACRLPDGTHAVLLTTEFTKDKHRHSLQMKLLARDGQSNGWVISAYLVGGKDSKLPTPGSHLAKRLRAHVLTFCLDTSKLNDSGLHSVYPKSQETKTPE